MWSRLKSKSLAGPTITLLVLCCGCASSEFAKMVTVNGRHVLAQSCSDARRLEEAIAEVQERRQPVREEMSEIKKQLSAVDARLELSSFAKRDARNDFQCDSTVKVELEKPSMALPEEDAGTFGWIVCTARELGTAVACDRAERRFGPLGGFACESTIARAFRASPDDLLTNIEIRFFQFLGNSELEQGQTGSGVIAHGLAALLQAQQFQACVNTVAAASHAIYQTWAFERQYLGREDELVETCHEWQGEHSRLRNRLSPILDQDEEMERELADIRAELGEVQAEIRRAGLRCQ